MWSKHQTAHVHQHAVLLISGKLEVCFGANVGAPAGGAFTLANEAQYMGCRKSILDAVQAVELTL